jgi:hypothetical protein
MSLCLDRRVLLPQARAEVELEEPQDQPALQPLLGDNGSNPVIIAG